MKNLNFWRTAAIVSTIVAACLCASAADVNGRIKGTVTDPAGAVVAHATITAINKDTGVKTVITSQADGEYLFQQLPVGTYSITATAPGFKAFTATGIVLTIDQEYVETIKMTVGSTTEVVSVEADTVQVNTTEMELSNIVDSTQLVELPLMDRSFQELELTEPGVQASSDRFGGAYSVSGGQTQQSEYLVNGADTNDIALNTLVVAPNLDAIGEFNLIEGSLNAEYDRNSGGIVSATIKQGSNKFHGDAFEFYRDTFMNSLSYFEKGPTASGTGQWTGQNSAFHQNIFGGTVGGPIFKNKLFFFGAFQGTKERTPSTASNVVYSSGQVSSGNFQDDLTGSLGYTFSSNPIPGTITIPGCTTAGETWAQCLGSGNGGLNGMVPTGSYNSIASALAAKYVPSANQGSNGYFTNGVEPQTDYQEIGRLDYSFNPKNQITFLGLIDKDADTETLGFTGASLPGFGEKDSWTIQQYTFDYVKQIGSSEVNDLAAHWTRFNWSVVFPETLIDPSSLGFNIVPEVAAGAQVPVISVAGFFTLGFSNNGPQPRIDQVYQLDDTFSKIVGPHSFKFGYDGRRFNVTNPFGARNNGSFSINTGGAYSSGDPSLDFLLGVPASYSQGSGAEIEAQAFLNYVFAQDSWKLTPTLTMDYGLGYSIDTPLDNHQYGGEAVICLIPGQTSTVFTTAPVGLNYPGDPGCGNSGQAFTRHTEFGPRLGFAWAPDLGKFSGGPGKFAINAGFGIYYDRTEEETALQTLESPPFGLGSAGAQDYDGGTPGFANPWQDLNTGKTFNNKFPFTFPKKGQVINYAPYEPIETSTFAPGFRAPYAENFQLSVERELPSKIAVRVSYVGSLARHNQATYEGNYETAAGHAACLSGNETEFGLSCASPVSNFNQLQAYYFPQNTVAGSIDPNTGNTGFTAVGEVGSVASSSYHALQAKVSKGLTHGLSFQVAYTLAHSLDTGSSFENTGFGGTRGYNEFDPAANYGNSAFDARQRVVFSPIYTIPTKSGSSPWSPYNLAISGWQITAISTLATGFPYDVSYGGFDSSNSLWCSVYVTYYACPDTVNQVGGLVRENPRVRLQSLGLGSQWFSNAGSPSFTPEVIGTFGNESRDKYHGPGINFTNLVLAKNFKLGSDNLYRLQVRLESDNVFNHTQFNLPSGGYSQGETDGGIGLGGIFGSGAARQSQLAAKLYF
ncbi:MAG: carboxypeptidase-like regulatory domain-containing protein [Terracidiphilus sp.]